MELWQGRRWRLLLSLITQLPRNSFFVEAVSQDEEVAAQMTELPQEPSGVRMSTWSPEMELLAAVFDRLGSVVAAVVASAGGRPPDIQPFPRPETAAQRARIKSRQEGHERLVKRLLN